MLNWLEIAREYQEIYLNSDSKTAVTQIKRKYGCSRDSIFRIMRKYKKARSGRYTVVIGVYFDDSISGHFQVSTSFDCPSNRALETIKQKVIELNTDSNINKIICRL